MGITFPAACAVLMEYCHSQWPLSTKHGASLVNHLVRTLLLQLTLSVKAVRLPLLILYWTACQQSLSAVQWWCRLVDGWVRKVAAIRYQSM